MALPDGATTPEEEPGSRAFIRFAARAKGLRETAFAETLEAVDRFAGDFATAMADEDRGGPAEQIARAMLRDGVNLSDPAAVPAWIGEYNAEQPG